VATTVAEIRAGMAANIAAVYQQVSLPRDEQATVSAYAFDSPSFPPIIEVKSAEDVEYNESMGRAAMTIYTFIIQGFAGTAFDIGSQMILDRWVSPGGLKAAVESDRSLGGKVHDTTVERCRHYGMFHLPSGSSFLGAEWVVRVYVPGA
jgi:hypothetical protein